MSATPPCWALFDADGALVAQVVTDGAEPDAGTGVAFARAVRTDGQADLSIERIDPATGAITADVEVLRGHAWQRIKAARDRAEWGGCQTALGRVDTDPDSQRKVGGAVQMAMIAQAAGAPFDLAWTMQDSASATHDAPAMIGMGVAVGQHVAACHAVALGKRGLLDDAGDAAAIAEVDVAGGWPGA